MLVGLVVFKENRMIKTRILERKRESYASLEAQYLEEGTTWFGLGKPYEKWRNISESYMGSSVSYIASKGHYEDAMYTCKLEIDKFLIAQGYDEKIIHWYPEVQNDTNV